MIGLRCVSRVVTRFPTTTRSTTRALPSPQTTHLYQQQSQDSFSPSPIGRRRCSTFGGGLYPPETPFGPIDVRQGRLHSGISMFDLVCATNVLGMGFGKDLVSYPLPMAPNLCGCTTFDLSHWTPAKIPQRLDAAFVWAKPDKKNILLSLQVPGDRTFRHARAFSTDEGQVPPSPQRIRTLLTSAENVFTTRQTFSHADPAVVDVGAVKNAVVFGHIASPVIRVHVSPGCEKARPFYVELCGSLDGDAEKSYYFGPFALDKLREVALELNEPYRRWP